MRCVGPWISASRQPGVIFQMEDLAGDVLKMAILLIHELLDVEESRMPPSGTGCSRSASHSKASVCCLRPA